MGDESEEENGGLTLFPGNALEGDNICLDHLDRIEFVLARCGHEQYGWHMRCLNDKALWRLAEYNNSADIANTWLGVTARKSTHTHTHTHTCTCTHTHTHMHTLDRQQLEAQVRLDY
jgi:hypothetical protein